MAGLTPQATVTTPAVASTFGKTTLHPVQVPAAAALRTFLPPFPNQELKVGNLLSAPQAVGNLRPS